MQIANLMLLVAQTASHPAHFLYQQFMETWGSMTFGAVEEYDMDWVAFETNFHGDEHNRPVDGARTWINYVNRLRNMDVDVDGVSNESCLPMYCF